LAFEVKIETSTHIVKVPVNVDGDGPFTFDLDTGATATTLSKTLAEKLGIPTRKDDRPDAQAFRGGNPARFAEAAISIGSLEFEKDEVWVLDLESIMPGAGGREGVLGYTTLKHCTMSLSYANQRFKLEKGDSSLDLNWSEFEYIKESHLVGIPVHINGKGPYNFVLDTGAGNSVVTPELATQLGLDAKKVEGIARGVGGDVELKLAALDSLSVGAAKIANSQVVVIDLGKVSPKGGLIENGIIGYDFLKNFETVIDYPKQRFAFVAE
jgi:predicted aspartyl protease